jgi:hypothetical protein
MMPCPNFLVCIGAGLARLLREALCELRNLEPPLLSFRALCEIANPTEIAIVAGSEQENVDLMLRF